MSLINCPECNNKISEYADSCPICGYPIKNHIAIAKKNENEAKNNFFSIKESIIICKLQEIQNSIKNDPTNKHNEFESLVLDQLGRAKNWIYNKIAFNLAYAEFDQQICEVKGIPYSAPADLKKVNDEIDEWMKKYSKNNLTYSQCRVLVRKICFYNLNSGDVEFLNDLWDNNFY